MQSLPLFRENHWKKSLLWQNLFFENEIEFGVSSNVLQKPLSGLALSSLEFWWITNQSLIKSFVYTNSLFKCLSISALDNKNTHKDEN